MSIKEALEELGQKVTGQEISGESIAEVIQNITKNYNPPKGTEESDG